MRPGLYQTLLGGSSAAPLPTTNLVFGLTADPAFCKRTAGGQTSTTGTTVGAWYDRVSGGNYAEQQTNTSRPILQSVGGLYAVSFDGANSTMAMPLAFQLGTYDAGCTIYKRMQFTGTVADTNYYWLIGRYSGETQSWFFGKSGSGQVLHTSLPGLTNYGPGDRAGAAFDGSWESWTKTYTPGTSVTLHRNGTLVNTASTSIGSTLADTRSTLGATGGTETGGGAQFWQGYLRHLLVYSEAHSAAQRAAVLAFLAT